MVDTASFRRPVRPLAQKELPPGQELGAETELLPNFPPAPEDAVEQSERGTAGEGGTEGVASSSVSSTSDDVAPIAPLSADAIQMQKKIESILADGLDAEFRVMTPVAREQFRTQGEKTASTIRQLIEQSKATAKKILDLIRTWLTMIPGVNRFFLEQEAKIKTDRILELSNPGEQRE